MGKKYIVEIGRLERLYKASISAKGMPNMTWLSPEVDLTPYTEPDLEQVRKEAYQKGYETGYEDGYNEPGKNQQEAYQRGLSDAWEAARKIVLPGDVSGIYLADLEEIFDRSSLQDVIKDYSASEAIEKIRQYEQEKEEQIQVGDEVIAASGKAVIIDISDNKDNARYIYSDSTLGFDNICNLSKTGRHFPEVAAVLAKMKESDNG